MTPRQRIRTLRQEIGTCLTMCRYAKASKPNYRNRLRLAQHELAKIRRGYPDLFNPRVQQTRLELTV